MQWVVILNDRAGSIHKTGSNDDPAPKLASLFRDAGIRARIRAVPGAEIAHETQDALQAGADGIVACGGDGTISSVANVLAQTSVPLGILPLGTHNHFAKDLGIPLELEEAVRLLCSGPRRLIDLGEVNGHFFINNSSIGAYPRAVEQREALRSKLGGVKWPAMLVATFQVFARLPLLHVRLDLDGRVLHRSTPFVFVGNNSYTMNLFNVSLRSCLDAGRLCVYTANCTGLACLFRLAWLSLANRLDQTGDFEAASASQLIVTPRKKRLRVAKDGEVLRLRAPLHYRIHSQALHVIAPSPPPA